MLILRLRQKKFIRGLSFLLACLFVIAVVCPMNYKVMAVDSTVKTLDVSGLWEEKLNELKWCDTNKNPLTAMWAYKLDISDKTNATVPITVVASTKDAESVSGLGQKIGGVTSYKESKITPYYYTYNGYNNSKIPNLYTIITTSSEDGLALYYTIEEDTALGGEYRRYYVSTANQLAVLLYAYENNINLIKVQATETDNKTAGINKVGITLLNDIDLGGANEICWYGYKNQSFVLDIDGQGHNIYNGYFKDNNNRFLGRSDGSCDNKFSIRNVTFSHMFIPQGHGMFGGNANGWRIKYAYFENVDFEYCMATAPLNTTSQPSTIVLGGHYAYCYLKDCTVRNSYVYGSSHCSTFATYNPEEQKSNNNCEDHRTISYLGDNTSGIDKYYYTSVPDLEEAELAWYGEKSQNENYSGKILTDKFPTIYENCASIDCEIYDTGMDSGTFISCQSGFIICKNCFTNSTMYGSTRTGVFLGACMGAGDGFYYDVDGKKEFTNSVFENCYTSGSIEGKLMIGGFVGTVFSDNQNRQKNSPDRGKLLFKNCYSTSSVGLQYASTLAVGGFVGDVWGNSAGTNSNKAREDEWAHIFKNCYAAGEVGNILICTDTEPTGGKETTHSTTQLTINDNNAVGGFMGTYHTDYPEIDINNCYYDKQTTAMRERDIGCSARRGSYSGKANSTTGTISEQLCGTKGIIGAYTKASTAKGVKGLTDTPNIMGDNTDWTYQTDYYPQLATFTENEYLNKGYAKDNLVDKMMYERALLYKRCSLASTATVFLDHYDEMLDKSGKSVSAIGEGVYDTVRDITSKFEFTSTCDDEITWSVDKDRNKSRGFASKLTGADGEGFTMTYDPSTGGATDTYDKVCSPSVLTIAEDDDVYKCFDFAPGKQWVRVDVSSFDGTDDFVGTRRLRLLPMAYLNAGDIISVKVKANESSTYATSSTAWTNEIILNDSGGMATTDKFNHSYGVVYAITERARQLGGNYNDQIICSYDNAKTNQNDDYFALYGGYLLDSPMNNKVGLDDDGEMFDQKFTGLKNDNNLSNNGQTMVRVFKTTTNKTGEDEVELVQGNEIDMTKVANRNKWEGTTPFTNKDAGYYYLRYYWRFDDGRYLEDVKLVYISESTYNVEAVTGILNKEHTVSDTKVDELYSPVDQYASSVELNTDNVMSAYPSAKDSFDPDCPQDSYENFTDEYTYNAPIVFDDGGTYYVKSDYISTSSQYTTVGWHYSNDYKMTTLIVEAHDIYADTWHEMARVDSDEVNARRNFDFNNAEYEYTFTTYDVTQNPETKLFTVATKKDNTATFKVETYKFNNGNDATSTDRYIKFYFGNEDDATLADINDDLRVTVLFRNTVPDVSGEKSVLLEADSSSVDDLTSNEAYSAEGNTGATALYAGEAYKSVDNSGLEVAERMAVLPGSTLTYRVHLQNDGFDDANDINVTDTVPDGCTFVDGSQRIYQQYKDITSGTVDYGGLKRLDKDSGYMMDYNDGTLTWTIPTMALDYDYYVEYKVTVDDIGYSTVSSMVENTAELSYYDNKDTLQTKSTNTVETDVAWAYLNIKKEIPVNDPTQTFLFRVDYYDSDTATKPSGTFYTDINCTDISEDNGVYSGNQIIQCVKAGKYVVTEMDDWSATDYDFQAAYYQANATASKTAVSGKSVTVTPASTLKNGAFLTAQAKNASEYAPVATFTSNESKYAYGSAQAGVENGFVIG